MARVYGHRGQQVNALMARSGRDGHGSRRYSRGHSASRRGRGDAPGDAAGLVDWRSQQGRVDGQMHHAFAAFAMQKGGALASALATTGSERGTAGVGARLYVGGKLARGWGGQIWGSAARDQRWAVCSVVGITQRLVRDGSQMLSPT